MAHLQKHPKTGIYWFRKRVPKDIRPHLGGKIEITRTLETRVMVEATEALRRIAAKFAEEWSEIRGESRSLKPKQRIALAGEIYREMIGKQDTDPGDGKAIQALLASDRDALSKLADTSNALLTRRRGLNFFVKFNVRLTEFLARKNISLSVKEQAKLLKAFVEAIVQANEQLLKNAQGDYSPDPKANRFPAYLSPEEERAASKSLVELYDFYIEQLAHSPGTIRRWRPKFAQFEEFIAPKAWHEATKHDVRGWRDELLKPAKFPDRQAIQPITIRDVHFAALRALFGFLEERELAKNPFRGVRVRMPKNARETGDKDLTEDAAVIILRAALAPQSPRMSPEYKAAYRWVPWILAYTGARVNEITQMRKQDVKKVDGVHVFNITPEAGGTKTNKARLIPVHPHLIETGFLKFVEEHAPGPLFYNAARTRGGKNATAPYKKVGERIAAWVRKLGITDTGVKPNHGWRHRLTSILVDMDVADRIVDSILGHKKKTYGNVRLNKKLHVVDRIPRIALDGAPIPKAEPDSSIPKEVG
jgi:integrase